MDVNGIRHATLVVDDLSAAVQFYETVLEIEPVGPDDEEAGVETAGQFWFRLGPGQYLKLVVDADRSAAGDAASGEPRIAFEVVESGLVALRARLDAAGFEYRESTASLQFRDPAGNLLAATTDSGPA
ncbi:MAG: VOC family protein [Halobacteriaceae archaeon]